LLALALIVAVPALAQTDETPPSPLQQPPIQEERTNPDAAAITGDSGLTITGTVQSVTDTAVVLNTTAGTHTIQFDNRTSRPATLNVGDRVAIDYTRNSSGVMIATAVRPEGGAVTGEVTATTTADTSVSTETSVDTSSESALQDDDDMATTGTTAGLDQDADADLSAESELPETGSELPLAGLIGLLALVAASGFRAFSRRNV
jgi:LPXTG-motif cell wall-anchored protein